MLKKLFSPLMLRLVILPTVIIFTLALYITDQKNFAFVISLATAFVGWTNSQILSNFNFSRSEISKARDHTAQYIEKLFDEMEQLFSDRSLKPDRLESILAARISILELRITHLKKRNQITLLEANDLVKLRDEPLDYLTAPDYKLKLTNLKFNCLEKIETQYSEWLSKN